MQLFLLLAIFTGICLWWFQRKNPINPIEDLENRAYLLRKSILEPYPSILLNKERSQERCEEHRLALDNIEADYLRLKNRFRHDEKKRIKVAQDFFEYTSALYSFRRSTQHAMMGGVEYNWNDWEDDIKEPRALMHEVEQRFKMLVGKDQLEVE